MNAIREIVRRKEDLRPNQSIPVERQSPYSFGLKSKEDILTFLHTNLLSKKMVNEDYLKSLWDREALGPTVISSLIAVPHGAFETVLRSCIQVVTLAHPVVWDGTNEVKMILNVVSTQRRRVRLY